MIFLGELAALMTSVCFTATSAMFTLAGRMVGSVVVNRTRLLFAVLLLALAHPLFGLPLPWHAEPFRWGWLGLSGLVGLALGDAFLFQAFVWIGPRLTMLMLSLAPILATVLAWLFLGERLSPWQVAAIITTIGGTAWVVQEQNTQPANEHNAHFKAGILFGLGAATGQALGLIFAKQGLRGDFPALSGTLMRMLAATLALWGLAVVRGQAAESLRQLRARPRALRYLVIGSITGPFLGVTLSLYAVQHAPVGIASTLTSLPPVLLLPVGYFFFKERFGWGAIAGTFIAIAGVVMLFLA
ncbi:MAG: DMT family transporter [Anaerolineae bacterium]|nr:MAG: DMT family transporter [Anaerolineae bacterium]